MALPVAPAERVAPAAVPVPRRHRRALVSLAAVALLAAPLAALGQRHTAVLTEAPATASTELFSTTPKSPATTPSATRTTGTAARKAGSTAQAKHGVASTTRLASATLPRTGSGGDADRTAQPAESADGSELGQDGSDGKGDGKTKAKDKHQKDDNGDGNGGDDG
jgi:hypothetical protein